MRPAIFLDRDGVLIDESDYPIVRPEQVRLLDGVASAIRRLNDAGWPVVVVTNQAIIARGFATEEDLARVHKRMLHLLNEDAGARIDAIYHCPHHPDPSQATRVQAFSVQCDCRKPQPGLLLRAAREMDLDLPASWMIGDSTSDLLAGQRAGVKTVLLTESGKGGSDAKHNVQPDLMARTLTDAVNALLS